MRHHQRVISLSGLRASCHSCSVSELCLPRRLEEDDLCRLETIVRYGRPIHRHAHLFDAGDPLQFMYAVRSGSFKSYVYTQSGEEEVLGFHLPGELLGFDAIETDYHVCSVVALETSSVCKFPFSSLEQLCQSVPGLHRQMYRLIGGELSREHAILLSLRHRSAQERLACFLWNISKRLEQRGLAGQEFSLSMSRHDIANYLGLTEETLCRVFARFQDEGVLSLDKRRCHIHEMARLRSLAGESAVSFRAEQSP